MTRLLKLAPVFAILLVVALPAMAQQLASDTVTHPAGQGRSNGAGVSWSLTYDRAINLVTFTVDGNSFDYVPPLGDSPQIFVRAYASDSFGDSGIRVDNVVLASDAAAGVLIDEFTVTADRTMSWSGKVSAQSDRAFRIEFGPMMPAYTFDDVTWGELKDLFNSSK